MKSTFNAFDSMCATVLLCMSILGVSGQTAAYIGGTDIVSTDEYQAVGKIGRCAGTLISPWRVLTAAHCVCDYDPTNYRSCRTRQDFSLIFPDGRGITIPAIGLVHPDYRPLPDYPDGSARYEGPDLAVFDLTRTVQDAVNQHGWTSLKLPVPMQLAPPSVGVQQGQTLTAIGYGETEDPKDCWRGATKNKVQLSVTVVSGSHETPNKEEYSVVDPARYGCRGDSGGPAVSSDGQVVGVLTGGSDGKIGVGRSSFTATRPYYFWIMTKENGPPWSPQPAVFRPRDDQKNPSIAWNSLTNEYLVVQEDAETYAGTTGISGQIIYEDGHVEERKRWFSSISGSNGTEPEVVFNPRARQYLLVWAEEWYGNSNDLDIKALRLDENGHPIGQPQYLTYTYHLDSKPNVAYDVEHNQYLVVWERRESESDEPENARGLAIVLEAVSLDEWWTEKICEQCGDIDVASGKGHYLATYTDYSRYHEHMSYHSIYGSWISNAGVFDRFLIDPRAAWQFDSSVTFNENTGDFYVAWADLDIDTFIRSRILGKLVEDGSGVDLRPTLQIDRGGWLSDPEIAYNSAYDEYMVAYQAYDWGGRNHVYYRYISADDRYVGPELPVARWDLDDVRTPALAVNSGGVGRLVVVVRDNDPMAHHGYDIFTMLSADDHEHRSDRWGGDMDGGQITLSEPHPHACEELCVNDDSCRSWTYVGQDGHGRCYLKDTIPQRVPAFYGISGVVR